MESRIPRLGGAARQTGELSTQQGPERGAQSPQSLSEMVRNSLTTSAWFQEMVTEVVCDCVASQLEEIRKENQQVRDGLSVLRSDMEQNSSESWKQGAIRLDKDMESLRDYVQKSTEMIWQQINSQSGGVARHPPNSGVKMEDEENENFRSRTPREKPRVESCKNSSSR